jgi:hypothetical protein
MKVLPNHLNSMPVARLTWDLKEAGVIAPEAVGVEGKAMTASQLPRLLPALLYVCGVITACRDQVDAELALIPERQQAY